MNHTIRERYDQLLQTGESVEDTQIIKYLGVFIYLGGVILALAHALSLINTFLPAAFLGIGRIGVFVIGLNALALPWAIHAWAFEKWHRRWAFFFYLADLLILVANALANSASTRGVTVPGLEAYMTWLAPASFILVVITWGTLFVLDPQNKERFEQQKDEMNERIATRKAEHQLRMANTLAKATSFERQADAILAAAEQANLQTPELVEDTLASPRSQSNGATAENFTQASK